MNSYQSDVVGNYNSREKLRQVAQGVTQDNKYSFNPLIQKALHFFGQGGGNPFANQASIGLSYLNPIGAATNVAQDIGSSIGARLSSPDIASLEALAKSYESKGDYKNSNMVRQQISQATGAMSKSFSPDINQNPVIRGVKGGAQVGMTAAVVSSLLSALTQGAGSAAGQSQGDAIREEIAKNARMNKIPENITPDPTSSIGNVTSNYNINDPKEVLLRNLKNQASNDAISTGRSGFIDFNAPIGGSSKAPIIDHVLKDRINDAIDQGATSLRDLEEYDPHLFSQTLKMSTSQLAKIAALFKQ